MTAKRTWSKIVRIMEIPLRLLMALFIAFSSFQLEPPQNAVFAAAGSTRVMCENDASLVGCWRMEEGIGTALHDGGAEPFNDGTLTNSPTWVAGKVGSNALQFNYASSQYVTIPNQASLNIANAITVAAWIKPTRAVTSDLVKKYSSNAGFEFSLSDAGATSPQKVFFRINNSARIDSTLNYPTDGTWIHAAATYDGTTMRMYINGVENATPISYSQPIVSNATNLTIGGIAGSRYFTGELDDVRIYNRALPAEQVAALASTTPPGDTTAPAAPTNLTPTAGNGTVGLTWTFPADPDVKGYNVYRGTSTGDYGSTPINGGTLVNTESYNDTGLTNGTPYFYTVKAVDTSGNSSVAAVEATATPTGDTTPPAAPTGLSATPGNTTITLNWTANVEGDLAGYNLYRGTVNGGPYPTKVNSTLLIDITTTDTGLTNGTPYYYVLKAVDTSTNESAASAQTTATPQAPVSCYALTVAHVGLGNNPTTNPTKSTACSTIGEYVAGESITFTAAPDPGSQVSSWTGTDNDALKTLSNTLTMPASLRTVTVTYSGIPSELCGSDPTQVGCWQMEEGSGSSLVDGSTFANNGTTTGSPTWESGKTGSFALLLNGTSQSASVPDNNILDMTTAFSIAGWIKPEKSGTQDLFKKADINATNGYEIGLSSGTKVLFRINQSLGPDTYRINSTTFYPINGTTWMHVAGTYSDGIMRLYINGVQEGSDLAAPSPNVNTLAFTMGTQATNPRFYKGAMDDVRLFNRALSPAEIQALAGLAPTTYTLSINAGVNGSTPIANPAKCAGCTTNGQYVAGEVITFTAVPDSGYRVANWTGTSNDSSTSTTNTVTMPSSMWTVGVTYEAIPQVHAPTIVSASPTDLATAVAVPVTLSATVNDVDLDDLTVKFYGREKPEDFTIIALPDTQTYSANTTFSTYSTTFNSQTNWIVNNQSLKNIVFVTHLGDIVNSSSTAAEWTRANTALSILEGANIPYGLAVGNHDQNPASTPGSTAEFNANFGYARFEGRTYYGGHYGTKNDNNYELFSASGMDFIIFHLEFDDTMDPLVVTWVDGLLQTFSSRRAIIVTHNLLNGTTPTTQTNAIWEGIKTRPNVFLMLGGHQAEAGKTTLTGTNGNNVDLLRSDYQSSGDGQTGYLRIMTFKPLEDQIDVTTYSPSLGSLSTSGNEFTLDYAMSPAEFTQIGTNQIVPSGDGTASVTWSGLDPNKQYEWYFTVEDATSLTKLDTRSFTTEGGANVPPVISESDPQAVTMSENGTPTPFNLTLHATDVDAGDTLTWSISSPASQGTASASGTGVSKEIGYVPTTDYTGSDSFVVQVSDGNGGTDTITVNVTINPVLTEPADLDCTTLNGKPMTATTGEKPQSKVWNYNGNWYAVFPTTASGASSAGTWLWKLQGTSWTEVLKLSTATNTKADVKIVGSLAHVLLYNDPSTQLASLDFSGGTYQLWSARSTLTSINLPGSEIATIDIDSTGRMWLATRQDSPSPAKIVVYYSDSPYDTFQGPVELASGVVSGDDISVVTAMPGNKIGVLWSNQNTKRFGFRVHVDGNDPTTWSADELPASQSAIDNIGTGMADDHLNIKMGSEGTLYAAVKTGYDTSGYPKMALLIRRPNGTWDDLYAIDEGGTRGNIELDEGRGVLTFVYTQAEGNNPIVYKQSFLDTISFGAKKTLRAESFNDVSSTKQAYNGELVIIYANGANVGGQICTAAQTGSADLAVTKTDGVIGIQQGDTLTYAIQVTNNGPRAVVGASVTDTLPSSLTAVTWTCSGSSGGTCNESGSGNINDLVNLPVNGSVTYSVTATVDLNARGTISNTASVTVPGGISDPNTSNNNATDINSILGTGASCEFDPSLVGCWQMEENGGSVLFDGSSNANNATLVGSPAWLAGKIGSYALGLNGTSQYAMVPDNSSLDLINGLTLATWIKPEQYATQDLIRKATNGSVDGYELALATTKTDASSRKPFFRINQKTSGDTYRINATTEYPIDGTWMHVAATYDGTTMKLYINGVLETSMEAPSINVNDLPLTLGAQDGTTASRWFMGSMDDTRVYNRPLTLAEIGVLSKVTYTISGNAGIGRAILNYTNGGPQSVIADGAGNYSFAVPLHWDGTVTPAKEGYSFGPAFNSYTDVSSDQTDQNFTATAITVTGTISMQGRAIRNGIPATLTGTTYGPYPTISINTVSNNLVFTAVPGGTYIFTTNQPRYLNISSDLNKTVSVTTTRTLPSIHLKGGNAVWSNNSIDINDAVFVGTDYGSGNINSDGDVNFDGKVDILDLTLVGINYDLTSSLAYTAWIP